MMFRFFNNLYTEWRARKLARCMARVVDDLAAEYGGKADEWVRVSTQEDPFALHLFLQGKPIAKIEYGVNFVVVRKYDGGKLLTPVRHSV